MTATQRLAAALLASSFVSAYAEPVLLDRVVAVINKSVLTEHELNLRIDTVKKNFTRQNMAAPADSELRSQVLERLVTERALTDYAADTGLKIDERQLDQTMERVAEQNKMSTAQFRQALEKEGSSYAQFREQLRSDLTLQRLRERDVDNRVFVTDAEIEQFIAGNPDASKAEQEFHLAHILINVPEGASQDEINQKQQKAIEAARQIAAGKPFGEVAAAFSGATDALQGGDLSWRSATRLPPMFLEAIQQLKPGKTSPILKSSAGFHLVKLIETRTRDAKEVISQTHARHILIKVNELTGEDEGRARIQEIRDRISNGAKFEEQAKLHSEDGSAQKGGDLDWVSPGALVPEFEEVMNQLQPGDLSQVTRSPFGWHLIQVIERRDQDVTVEKQRERVRLELRQRKADTQYEDWVRQQRDQAFVELRLEDK